MSPTVVDCFLGEELSRIGGLTWGWPPPSPVDRPAGEE